MILLPLILVSMVKLAILLPHAAPQMTPTRREAIKRRAAAVKETPPHDQLQESNTSRTTIFSDWDDTIACSGHSHNPLEKTKSYLAGVDRSLPHGTIYPGSMEFYAKLGPELVIVSANPQSADSQRAKKQAMIDNYCNQNGMQSCPKITKYFPGSKSANLAQMDPWTLYRSYAADKIERVLEYHEQNPSTKGKVRIFMGDNGQGDHAAALELINLGLIDYAFIHKVTDRPYLRVQDHRKIRLFQTYEELNAVSQSF